MTFYNSTLFHCALKSTMNNTFNVPKSMTKTEMCTILYDSIIPVIQLQQDKNISSSHP